MRTDRVKSGPEKNRRSCKTLRQSLEGCYCEIGATGNSADDSIRSGEPRQKILAAELSPDIVLVFAGSSSRARMVKAWNVKLICLGIFSCVAVMAFGEQKAVTQDGVSLTYDTTRFSKVEIVELKREPLPHPRDQLNVHPANLLFLFYVGSHCVGSIKLYPLGDRSVDDLNAVYPELLARAETLSRLLHDRPRLPQRYPSGIPKEIPTIQNQMAGQYFLSHVRYLDFSWGSGVGFLVQYAQDASSYAVGSRLDYQIEGLTADRKIAVSAYFDVAHPDLPPTEKDALVTDKVGEPIGEAAYMKYLRQMETLLSGSNSCSPTAPGNCCRTVACYLL